RSHSETKVHLSMSITKRPLLLGLAGLIILSLLVAAFAFTRVQSTHAAPISFQTVPLTRAGTASLDTGGTATDTSTQAIEIDAALNGDADADGGGGDEGGGGVNRTLPGAKTGHGKLISPSTLAKSNPTLGTNFEGLNLFNQRFANNGNQFSVEPP